MLRDTSDAHRLAALVRVSALLLIATTTLPAGAEDPTECVADHAKGQDDKKTGKLLSARESFIRCAAEACPKVVREECASLLARVDSSMASIVVHAVAPDGRDTRDVAVTIDGIEVASQLTSAAIPLEPGDHSIKLRYRTGLTHEEQLTLLEGVKNRVVEVTFEQARSAPTQPQKPAESREGTPAVVWVLGGVSAVALGSFAYFALDGRSKEKDVNRCTPNCTDAEYDAMMKRYLVADISLGVSVLAGGAAVYLAVSSKSKPDAPAVGLAPVRGGGGLRFMAHF